MNIKLQKPNLLTPRAALRVGFVPLTDCAPLVMAQELGLFDKHGLRVRLSRELGWATIRDKIIHRELDAAHAVAAMPLVATLGLGSVRCECLTALVLNLHGNAITLSSELWHRGVRDGATLRELVLQTRRERTFTFGVVYPHSSHHFLLRGWLASAGIDPDRDVRIVVVPPPQMVANLKARHLDGFCVGEPWNSVASKARSGWCVATSAELDPGHPEKVLMVRKEFAEKSHDRHLALVAAILDACEYCDRPEHRERVIHTLSRPEFVGVAAGCLSPSFDGRLDFGHGLTREVRDFTVFHRYEANDPCDDKAAWVLEQLCRHRYCPGLASPNFALTRRVFRTDLFAQAVSLRSTPNLKTEPHEIETVLV